ncbi:uncharacterized protein LOC129307742 [Prosopis cineraria]|uniref:uncharacterized protein LOC129307742 n=1 Tax=Prosopis cineraria TaxID=364024 RepID=UPI00241092B9|nr:uncharacterized protein LOC129307742 [Prosopis cineraria]
MPAQAVQPSTTSFFNFSLFFFFKSSTTDRRFEIFPATRPIEPPQPHSSIIFFVSSGIYIYICMAAADGFFRGVYEGCISGHDNDVQRRPYHRNCGCAIHDKSSSPKARCSHRGKSNNVSYPLRRAWSESCLAMAASASSASAHSSPSPSSSPVAAATTLGKCSRPLHHHQMGLTDLQEED